MNFQSSLLILIISISAVKSAQLHCEFGIHSNKLYTCNGDESFTTDDEDSSISKIVGSHLSGKSNDNVKQLIIENATVHYFPNHLSSFFPYLESIVIKNCEMKYLRKSAFIGLEHLKVLNLSRNEIEMIGPEMFEENNKLEVLDFGYNQIGSLTEDILSMASLKAAKFNDNFCINMIFDLEHRNHEEFRENVKNKCVVSEASKLEQSRIELQNALKQLEEAEKLIRLLTEEKKTDSTNNDDDKSSSASLELEAKITEMETVSNALQQDIARVNSEKDMLENELDDTKENLGKAQNKILELNETLEAKNEEVSQIKKDKKVTENINKQLKLKMTKVAAMEEYVNRIIKEKKL